MFLTLAPFRTRRCFFVGFFAYNFVASFIFLTFFSARCTVPDFRPVPDLDEPFDVSELRFGAGRVCLGELLAARYVRRSCMVPCRDVPADAGTDLRLRLAADYISFDRVLKVSGRSAHAAALTDRFQGYAMSGMCERMYGQQNVRSYADLVETRADPPMRVGDIVQFVYALGGGLAVATGVFAAELAVGGLRAKFAK